MGTLLIDNIRRSGGFQHSRKTFSSRVARTRWFVSAKLMGDTKQESPGAPGPTPISPPRLAPMLMMIFWMLLGGAAGIKLTQSMWRVFALGAGEVSIAVPLGSVMGAFVGALLGLISNPRLLVLLMAVFAGSTAGAVAGKLPWGDLGEIAGQVAGGFVGGIAWAVWLFLGGGKGSNL